MALFSIVIPTLNRRESLEFAIRSCLAQTEHDFELVVSDNFSDYDCRSFVASIGDERIRYHRTDSRLTLVNSFEFAITRATGEYVVMIADDEALRPGALARFRQLIELTECEVASFGRTNYIFPDAGKGDQDNTLLLREYTGRAGVLPSSAVLKRLFSLKAFEDYYFARPLPLSVKSFLRRDVIDRIIARHGSFHLPSSPDWGACGLILSEVEQVHFLDEFWNVAGLVPNSCGGAVNDLDQDSDLYKQYRRDFKHTPTKIMTLYNLCINSFLGGQALCPELKPYTLNPERYVRLVYKDLITREKKGTDAGSDLKELEQAAQSMGVAFPPEMATPPERKGLFPIRIDMADYGVSNIVECTRQMDRVIEDYPPDEAVYDKFQEVFPDCQELFLDNEVSGGL